MTQEHAYVGSTKEIWDAINVDLQQIVDDVSCWQGKHAERMCGRLGMAIVRLNAAVSHERAGYESAIAAGYAADKAAEERDEARAELAKLNAQKSCATLHDDGHWTWNGTRPHESDFAGWRLAVYFAAGAGGPT